MHCFLDSAFAYRHSLPTTPTPPMELHLFDGTSNNIIFEVVLLSIKFSSSECMTLDFYITPLDFCCSLVLGHSWLTCYNPLINWVSGSISFWPPSLFQNLAFVSSVETLVNPPFSPVKIPLQFTPSEMFPSNPKQPHITIINVPAVLRTLCLLGLTTFFSNSIPQYRPNPLLSPKKSTSLLFQRDTTSTLMFLASPKQKHSLPTILMTFV